MHVVNLRSEFKEERNLRPFVSSWLLRRPQNLRAKNISELRSNSFKRKSKNFDYVSNPRRGSGRKWKSAYSRRKSVSKLKPLHVKPRNKRRRWPAESTEFGT